MSSKVVSRFPLSNPPALLHLHLYRYIIQPSCYIDVEGLGNDCKIESFWCYFLSLLIKNDLIRKHTLYFYYIFLQANTNRNVPNIHSTEPNHTTSHTIFQKPKEKFNPIFKQKTLKSMKLM